MKWVPEKKAFDEAFDKKGTARQHYQPLVSILESFTQGEVIGKEFPPKHRRRAGFRRALVHRRRAERRPGESHRE